jgi:cytochrome c oxidase subunit 1
MNPPAEEFRIPEVNYLNEEKTLFSWLFTHDHKRIALLYLFSITIFFLIGGVAALLMRLELIHPHGEMFTSTA